MGLISKLLGYKALKNIRSGTLYWMANDYVDLETFFLRRLFRKFGIAYVPFTLRFYDRLFLREEGSKYNRALVRYCKKHGIQTYLVQEAWGKYIEGRAYIPMEADYFMCPHEYTEKWVNEGMERGRIINYYYQKTSGFKGIVFMMPLYLYERDGIRPQYWEGLNSVVMGVIDRFLKEDVVFKLHRKNADVVRRFIPTHRIVTGDAKELMMKYEKVYCFSMCSIVKDCEMMGIEPTVLQIKGDKI